MERELKALIDKGANVFISQKGIDEHAGTYLTKKNCVAISNVSKKDFFKLIRLTGGGYMD